MMIRGRCGSRKLVSCITAHKIAVDKAKHSRHNKQTHRPPRNSIEHNRSQSLYLSVSQRNLGQEYQGNYGFITPIVIKKRAFASTKKD